eukprot:1196285-Amphidinium_carterae.1
MVDLHNHQGRAKQSDFPEQHASETCRANEHTKTAKAHANTFFPEQYALGYEIQACGRTSICIVLSATNWLSSFPSLLLDWFMRTGEVARRFVHRFRASSAAAPAFTPGATQKKSAYLIAHQPWTPDRDDGSYRNRRAY